MQNTTEQPYMWIFTPPSPRKTRRSRPGGNSINLNGRHDPVGADLCVRPSTISAPFPRAADCRPYGVERGRSVIGGRGRFVIGGRADTQVGPYKTQGALGFL